MFCLGVSLAVDADQAARLAELGVDNPQRTRVDYMLNCQGCHGADGSGTADGSVPTMKNFVGKFLSVPGGREFIARVPGVANAALADEPLADLLNWVLVTQSNAEIPDGFQAYTPDEIAQLRQLSLQDVLEERALLVSKMPAD